LWDRSYFTFHFGKDQFVLRSKFIPGHLENGDLEQRRGADPMNETIDVAGSVEDVTGIFLLLGLKESHGTRNRHSLPEIKTGKQPGYLKLAAFFQKENIEVKPGSRQDAKHGSCRKRFMQLYFEIGFVLVESYKEIFNEWPGMLPSLFPPFFPDFGGIGHVNRRH
jgi:hypothetical protein